MRSSKSRSRLPSETNALVTGAFHRAESRPAGGTYKARPGARPRPDRHRDALAGAYSFTNLMLAHHEAAVMTGRQAQARSLVDSGVTAVQLFLSQAEADRNSRAASSTIPSNFAPCRGARTTTIPTTAAASASSRPTWTATATSTAIRYGLEDESTRLNLNVLLILDKQVAGSGRTLLMGLPGMTEDVADAILDWLDPDDEPRELGCEVEYYSGLSPPYAPKNGPVDTVEELLLVRGVTPQLLFGCRHQPQRPARSARAARGEHRRRIDRSRAPSAAGRPI